MPNQNLISGFQNAPSGSIKLLQITDMHLFDDQNGTLLGLNTNRTFEAVVDLVKKSQWPADMIITTGDLVHDLSISGYQKLYQKFATFKTPVYCLPGNHDNLRNMSDFLNHDNVHFTISTLLKNWHFIFLSSHLSGSTKGHLADDMLKILSHQLAQQPHQHTLVCVHHHPVDIGSRWLDTMRIDNADALFEILDQHSQVKGVLWGHIHQQFESVRKNVKLLGSPSTCIQFKPKSVEFSLDHNPPGFRWLILTQEGDIITGVDRIKKIPESIDFNSGGYE